MTYKESSNKTEYYRINRTQRILLLEQLTSIDKKSAAQANLICLYAYTDNNFNADAFENAFYRILENNDALRIRLTMRFPFIRQYYYDGAPAAIERITCDNPSAIEEEKAKIQKVKLSLFNAPLYCTKIVDCSNGSGALLVCFHHIVFDGFSVGLFLSQLDKYYREYLSGEISKTEKVYSYKAYSEAEYQYLKSPQYTADKKWWWQKYSSQRNMGFPTGRGSGGGISKSTTIDITGTELDSLTGFCRDNRCSIQSVVMTITAISIAAVTGVDNFSICSLFHGRTTLPLKRTIGCILSNFYMYYDLKTDKALNSYINDSYMDYLDALSHGRTPPLSQYPFFLRWSLWPLKNFYNFNYVWLEFSAMDYADIIDKLKLYCGVIEYNKSINQLYCAVLNVSGKQLTIAINYQPATIPESKVLCGKNMFNKCIETLLSNPEITVNDLIHDLQTIK